MPVERLVAALPTWPAAPAPNTRHVVGVIAGEGIGPEMIGAALHVLDAVQARFGIDFDLRHCGLPSDGGEYGPPAGLTDDVVSFCESIFSSGGALLCGPVGGRFVYDLRARFDLFCKLTPIRPVPALADVGAVRPEARQGVDIVMVRENLGGAYFASESIERGSSGITSVNRASTHDRETVERIVDVGARLAGLRSGHLTVVVKPGGMPALTDLWREVADSAARRAAIEHKLLAVDYAAYHLVARARELDVVVSPNLMGDVLADCGGLLLGSRGMTWSGNFGPRGAAAYQTGHGAAFDLAGTDRANPFGQISSLAMMLRESFALEEPASAIERAIDSVLADGCRTADIAAGPPIASTRAAADAVAEAVERESDGAAAA